MVCDLSEFEMLPAIESLSEESVSRDTRSTLKRTIRQESANETSSSSSIRIVSRSSKRFPRCLSNTAVASGLRQQCLQNDYL